MIKVITLIFSLGLTSICFSQQFKEVGIYNDSICFKIPDDWIYHPKYRTFSNYEIIYDGKYSNKNGCKALLLEVYDARFGSDTVNMVLLENQKKERIRMVSPDTKYLTTGIKKVDGINVGFFTYTYKTIYRKLNYGVQLFFKIPSGNFVHVEVFNEADSLNKSKPLIDSVVASLNFK